MPKLVKIPGLDHVLAAGRERHFNRPKVKRSIAVCKKLEKAVWVPRRKRLNCLLLILADGKIATPCL